MKILRQFLRVADILPKFKFLTPNEQGVLLNVLTHSKAGAAPELKLKVFQTLKRLKKVKKKPFGMLIVLGWKSDWFEKYASFPDSEQNLFDAKPFDFARAPNERALEILAKISDFDGALLLNSRGEIVASGVYLENMDPKDAAKAINPDKAEDLSGAFRFATKVHSRHLAAIAASYRLKGTTVFAVSEEGGSVRVFEKGRIIYSTISKEI
jgi:DNA integrity scanning protein DisA with diadenylate cyclase activity